MDAQSLASQVENISESSLQCQSCKKDNKFTCAAMRCETCNVYLCSECSRLHVRFTFENSHTMTFAGIDSKKALKIDIPAEFVTKNTTSVDMQSIDRCSKHKELLKYVCQDDDQLCCSICAIVEHRKCENVLEIKTAAKNNKDRFSIDASHVLQISDKNKSIMHFLFNTKMALSRQMDDLPKTLDCMHKQLNDWFNKCCSRAIKVANDQTNENISRLQERHVICESLAKSISKTLEIYTNIMQHGTLVQQCIVQHKLKSQIQDYRKTIIELASPIETLKLIPKLADPISNLLQSGSVIVDVELNTVPIDKMPDYRSVDLELIVSTDVKQSENEEKVPLYSGMDYLADGRLVVADNFNKKLLMMNEKLETICTLTTEYSPLSVVAVSKDSFAVTGCQGVHIYSINASNDNPKLQFKETIKTKIWFDSISIKNDDCFAVGTFDNPIPALILSMNGVETEFNVSLPNKQYAVAESACTYMKSSDKLILSDRDDDTVYITDVKNNTTIRVKDETIKTPRYVVCGPNETILVCSSGTNSLIQISSNGQILSSHKLDMCYPSVVCVSADLTKLAVADFADIARKLHIYSIRSNR